MDKEINLEQGRWLLMRPSGTEPLIRIYAETECLEMSKKLIEKGKDLVL